MNRPMESLTVPPRSFGHLEVVGTQFLIVLHLDRQRSRLDVLEFFVDVDRRNRMFFGTLLQDPETYLVPAERNARPRLRTSDSIGFEVIVAVLDPTGATDPGRISLGRIRRENQVSAIEGLAVQRDRPCDRY